MIEDSDHEFRADFAQCSDIGAAAVHVAKLELMPQTAPVFEGLADSFVLQWITPSSDS